MLRITRTVIFLPFPREPCGGYGGKPLALVEKSTVRGAWKPTLYCSQSAFGRVDSETSLQPGFRDFLKDFLDMFPSERYASFRQRYVSQRDMLLSERCVSQRKMCFSQKGKCASQGDMSLSERHAFLRQRYVCQRDVFSQRDVSIRKRYVSIRRSLSLRRHVSLREMFSPRYTFLSG